MKQYRIVFQNDNDVVDTRVFFASYYVPGKITTFIDKSGRPVFSVHEDKLHSIEDTGYIAIGVITKQNLEEFEKGWKENADSKKKKK